MRAISLDGYLVYTCYPKYGLINNCIVRVTAVRNVLRFSEITHRVKDESEVIVFLIFPNYGRQAEAVGPV